MDDPNPLGDGTRSREFDRVADDDVEALFPWRETTPEEYAARYAHQFGSYSFDERRYRNPAIGRWAVRLGEILHSAEETERVRRQYLSAEEYAKVQQEIADILEHGL